jgi:hypothetical protein
MSSLFRKYHIDSVKDLSRFYAIAINSSGTEICKHRVGIQLFASQGPDFTCGAISIWTNGYTFENSITNTHSEHGTHLMEEYIYRMFTTYGIEYTTRCLDGAFSFVLLDNSLEREKIYVVSDPFGISPLSITTVCSANEGAARRPTGDDAITISSTRFDEHSFPAATYAVYYLQKSEIDPKWIHEKNVQYYQIPNFTPESTEKKTILLCEILLIYLNLINPEPLGILLEHTTESLVVLRCLNTIAERRQLEIYINSDQYKIMQMDPLFVEEFEKCKTSIFVFDHSRSVNSLVCCANSRSLSFAPSSTDVDNDETSLETFIKTFGKTKEIMLLNHQIFHSTELSPQDLFNKWKALKTMKFPHFKNLEVHYPLLNKSIVSLI